MASEKSDIKKELRDAVKLMRTMNKMKEDVAQILQKIEELRNWDPTKGDVEGARNRREEILKLIRDLIKMDWRALKITKRDLKIDSKYYNRAGIEGILAKDKVLDDLIQKRELTIYRIIRRCMSIFKYIKDERRRMSGAEVWFILSVTLETLMRAISNEIGILYRKVKDLQEGYDKLT